MYQTNFNVAFITHYYDSYCYRVSVSWEERTETPVFSHRQGSPANTTGCANCRSSPPETNDCRETGGLSRNKILVRLGTFYSLFYKPDRVHIFSSSSHHTGCTVRMDELQDKWTLPAILIRTEQEMFIPFSRHFAESWTSVLRLILSRGQSSSLLLLWTANSIKSQPTKILRIMTMEMYRWGWDGLVCFLKFKTCKLMYIKEGREFSNFLGHLEFSSLK